MKKTILALLFLSSISMAADNSFDITLNIKNVEKKEGKIYASIVSDANDFPTPKKEQKYSTVLTPQPGSVSFVFKGVTPGKYAITIYQDINDNKQLDVNFIGIPKEPWAVSGKPGMGKPKFEDCAFDVKQNMTVDLELK